MSRVPWMRSLAFSRIKSFGPPGYQEENTLLLLVVKRSDTGSLKIAETKGSGAGSEYSCWAGVCHTCMTGLIGGSITYKPEPLERPASGNVLVCCSYQARVSLWIFETGGLEPAPSCLTGKVLTRLNFTPVNRRVFAMRSWFFTPSEKGCLIQGNPTH
jgi:ferredoxin